MFKSRTLLQAIPRATRMRFYSSKSTFAELAKDRKATTEECWRVFDSLPGVTPEELSGWRWKGYEISNNHPWDGLLKKNNWFGKEYFSPEHGNPLLTYASDALSGNDVFPAEPIKWFAHVGEGGDKIILYKCKDELLAPENVGCTLKTILYRGCITASMFYDQLPVNDTFKKVDDNTVYGVMDCKFLPDPPLFFVLEKYKPLKQTNV